ncbi:MAG: response regulator [Candidatus Omnitrophota bacterium]
MEQAKQDINILVVDDEEVMRSLFTDILQEEGYNVVTAADGKEAEDIAKRTFFNAAFIDIHMPVRDGVQTLSALKRISPKTAIVMMDSYPDLLLKMAEHEGAVTSIHKPFDINEIREAMKKAVEQSKQEGS